MKETLRVLDDISLLLARSGSPLVRFADIPPTGAPRGEGVDQRETDEGTTNPTDVELGGAVCLPRIKEKSCTLCLDDYLDKSAPHPTNLLRANCPPSPRGEGFLCYRRLKNE